MIFDAEAAALYANAARCVRRMDVDLRNLPAPG